MLALLAAARASASPSARSLFSASTFSTSSFSTSTSSTELRSLRRSVLVLNAGSSSLKLKLFEEQEVAKKGVSGEGRDGGTSSGKQEPLLVPVASALVERLGTGAATLRSWRRREGEGEGGGDGIAEASQRMGAAEPVSARDVAAALSAALPRLGLSPSSSAAAAAPSPSPPRRRRRLVAVGNRVVHGGELSEPRLWTDAATRRAVAAAAALAPLHNPSNAAAADAARALFPAAEGTAHVAVFDTAFHVASMEPEAFSYALPPAMRSLSPSSPESSSSSSSSVPVRKYGFHGSSFKHAVAATAGLLGVRESELDAVCFHLGAGASACAVRKGKSVDTSLGATPLQGLVMATRSGDVDPAVPLLIAAQRERERERGGESGGGKEKGGGGELVVEEVLRSLNREAGLAALAGPGVAPTGDMRDVIAAAEKEEEAEEAEEAGAEGSSPNTSSSARLALSVYVHRVRHYLGAYLLGRHLSGSAHAVVFTGGVGENSPLVRARALEGLGERLGIEVCERRNAAAVGLTKPVRIDAGKEGAIAVVVVPADEEAVIAREAWEVAMRAAEKEKEKEKEEEKERR